MNKNNYYAIIMAGGLGARLWPLSRRKKPKQLHSLMTEEPMIKDTYLRLLPLFKPDKIIISTIPNFVADIKKILPDVPDKNYIVEPALMGNAAACGLVSELLYDRDKDSVAFFMPADAFIENKKEFEKVIRFAQDLVGKYPNKILTVGIRPGRPETGYGYIKMGESFSSTITSSSGPAVKLESGARGSKIVNASLDSRLRGNDDMEYGNDETRHLSANKVASFVEKPDLKTAEKYFKAGNYLWNAGIFGWRTDHIIGLFKEHMPDTYKHLENIRAGIGKNNFKTILEAEYSKVENTSIDYGIIEKTKDILVIPANFGWSDVGSWGSLLEVLTNLEKTESIHRGHHVGIDNVNCMVLGGKKLIATIGLENIVVVDTEDALLICHKDQSHKVKDLIMKLKEEGKHEYL